MGTAAAHHADVVILTSDNPRSEPPEAIAADVMRGVPSEARVTLIFLAAAS